MKTISQAPTPVPTANVSLSREFVAMTERLAETAHGRQAAMRTLKAILAIGNLISNRL